jgi:hypothetical protein
LRDGLAAIADARPRPIIPAARVLGSVFVMLVGRLGSLNALEQSRASRPVRSWIGGAFPSADTLGRVMAKVDVEALRHILRDVFVRLKRNKGFAPPAHGLVALVIDGHEGHSSYRRCCTGCLTRSIKIADEEREQYYHRYVAAHLVGRDFTFLVDLEPLQRGEGEVIAAKRLLARVHERYARAYDVVLADALYAEAPFWREVRDRGKHILVVLKQEARDLLADARALFGETPPIHDVRGNTRREIRDVVGCTSWPGVKEPVRVIQSVETKTVRRQIDRTVKEDVSEWIWATSLPPEVLGAKAVVALAHQRWSIENQGFNELVNHWHGDHLYRHEPAAILAFLLMTFLAFNVFHVFYHRNVKAALRKTQDKAHIARLILADLYPPRPAPADTS